jgi:hypothetical protein
MSQAELFPRPPAYHFTIRLDDPHGWTVLACRLDPERPPRDSDRETYTALSLSEAIDVVAGVILTD